MLPQIADPDPRSQNTEYTDSRIQTKDRGHLVVKSECLECVTRSNRSHRTRELGTWMFEVGTWLLVVGARAAKQLVGRGCLALSVIVGLLG